MAPTGVQRPYYTVPEVPNGVRVFPRPCRHRPPICHRPWPLCPATPVNTCPQCHRSLILDDRGPAASPRTAS